MHGRPLWPIITAVQFHPIPAYGIPDNLAQLVHICFFKGEAPFQPDSADCSAVHHEKLLQQFAVDTA